MWVKKLWLQVVATSPTAAHKGWPCASLWQVQKLLCEVHKLLSGTNIRQQYILLLSSAIFFFFRMDELHCPAQLPVLFCVTQGLESPPQACAIHG